MTEISLIFQAIQFNKRKPGVVRVQDIYAALPDLVCVGEQWQVVLGALYPPLLTAPVFHSITP